MNKKIVSVILLVMLLICNIGNVFGNDVNNESNGIENKIEIDEHVQENNESLEAEAGNNEQENEKIKTNDDIKEKAEDEYFNVTFIYDKTEVKKVKNGEKVSPPNIIIKSKNTYVVWVDEEGEVFNFNTPITKDITLTLELTNRQVDPGEYHIRFYENGGSKVKDIWMYAGNSLQYLPKTTKSGYKFIGWFDKNGKEWKNGMTPKDDLDLYAKWQPLNLSSAKTGDSSHIGLYLGMMLIAGAGMYLSLKGLRKKYN